MPLHDGPHPDPRGVKLTYDDYVLFPEDRFRHELILTDANVQGVPELIVEIAAPNTRRRDETFKRRLYERVGVTEYWVIDALIDHLHVYRRTGEHFALPVEFLSSERDVLTTPLLAGFELPLADIFDTRGLSFPSWY